ncbi:MAG: hypothetical protein JWR24_339, partial [Actinoallomurus sp.]|nr:hypothetical protein [Actinoallomurus sp.]
LPSPVVADSDRQSTHRNDSRGSLVRRTTQGSTV